MVQFKDEYPSRISLEDLCLVTLVDLTTFDIQFEISPGDMTYVLTLTPGPYLHWGIGVGLKSPDSKSQEYTEAGGVSNSISSGQKRMQLNSV